jgi:hypothetical protein
MFTFKRNSTTELDMTNRFGGYEKNRFYLNQRGAAFIEVGHLLGVSLEEDSRGVVADDLDGDGRLDMLLTTFEAWPGTKQTLRVYQNNLNDTGNWIGSSSPRGRRRHVASRRHDHGAPRWRNHDAADCNRRLLPFPTGTQFISDWAASHKWKAWRFAGRMDARGTCKIQ